MRNERHPDDEAVRRLLGAVSSPPPAMPDAVVARLDDLIADLATERSQGAGDDTGHAVATGTGTGAADPPVSLAERRRRRWPQLLVAAAAVSVIGLGLGNLDLSSQDAESAGSADTASEEDDSGGGELDASGADGGEAAPQAAPSRDGGAVSDERARDYRAAKSAAELRSGSLASDVQRAAALALDAVTLSDRGGGCVSPVPRVEAGDEVLPVSLDGRRALLVLRAPESGTRAAQVYLCRGGGQPAASTTVEAR